MLFFSRNILWHIFFKKSGVPDPDFFVYGKYLSARIHLDKETNSAKLIENAINSLPESVPDYTKLQSEILKNSGISGQIPIDVTEGYVLDRISENLKDNPLSVTYGETILLNGATPFRIGGKYMPLINFPENYIQDDLINLLVNKCFVACKNYKNTSAENEVICIAIVVSLDKKNGGVIADALSEVCEKLSFEKAEALCEKYEAQIVCIYDDYSFKTSEELKDSVIIEIR